MPIWVDRIATAPARQLTYAFDSPRPGPVVGAPWSLPVVGWVVSRDSEILGVQIRTDGRVACTAKLTLPRPRVKKRLGACLHADCPGFRAVVDARGVSELGVWAALADGREHQLACFRLTEQPKVRVLYVHIAKTGGTSLNRLAASLLPKDEVINHLETVPDWQSATNLHELSYLSGHLSYELLKRHLNVDSFVKAVTLRRPIDQVVSHLAWVRRLTEPGQERGYQNALSHIQELSHKLARLDLSDPEPLAKLVRELDGRQLSLLDNTQTRYLCQLGMRGRVGDEELEAAIANLAEFDVVGVTEQYGEFIRRLCALAGWPVPRAEPRQNTTLDKYGLDANLPGLREALEPIIAYDELLYEEARVRATSALKAPGVRRGPGKVNVLVIGPAKTGTTVISKTIQRSLPGAAYHLEPKRMEFFERGPQARSAQSRVVKIIFEHWNHTPRMRSAIVFNEAALKFDKVVCIVRDPRDEMLSRMLYVILPYSKRHGHCPNVVEKWVELLEHKQRAPREVPVGRLLSELRQLTGYDGLGHLKSLHAYSQFLQQHRECIFVLRYEDFMQGRLEALETYLGFKLSPDRDVGDLTRVLRTRAFDNWRRWFTPEDVIALRDQFAEPMQALGYEGWELEQPETLDPEHGSLYVRRLMQEHLGREK